MILHRVRLTIRGLMVVVAIAGVGLAWLLERRSASLRREAARHAGDGTLVTIEEMYNPSTEAGKVHHRALAEKYRQAARRPWLSVTPDPPEPK